MYKIIDKQTEWDRFVVEQGGHPLQLWAWGEVKSAHGPWSPVRILFQNGDEIVGGAQVLQRKMPKPFGKMLYVPRGGFGSPKQRSELLKELGAWAKEQGGVELKIEPDWTLAGKLPEMKGWRKSKNRILLARTLRLDLTKTEDELLADMSKKTRQYIRKSEKDGVQIQRISDKKDLLTALKIYKETAERDGFSLHGDSYYLDIAKFGGDFNQIFLAEKDGRPLAFLWNLATQANCFELYGGVNREGQDLRANYALKWHAIKFAKSSGSVVYDLNGLLNDGVSNFKLGFSNEETNLVGTWDLPLSPLYLAWEKVLPFAKKSVQKFNNLRKNQDEK